MKKALLVYLLLLCCSFTSIFAQTGAPDLTFGTEGRYSYEIDSLYSRGFFGLQSDEKIIMVSSQWHTDALGIRNEIFTMRFLADGGIDSSYGTNGHGDYISIPEGDHYINDMAVQTDDKILVGGKVTVLSKPSFLICRFNADGTVDSGFAENGYKIIPITVGSDESISCIEVLSDGKILLIGRIGPIEFLPALVRLNEDGSMDSSFGTDGIWVVDDIGYNVSPRNTTIQNDNKILISFWGEGSPRPLSILRLNANGTRDNTFGTGGIAKVLFPQNALTNNVQVQLDNKIVVIGDLQYPTGEYRFRQIIIRLNRNGTLDTTFGTSGKTINEIGYDLNSQFSNIQQTDGKILSFNYIKPNITDRGFFATIRYSSNGFLDTEWNEIGYRVDSFHEVHLNQPDNIFYTNDGKVLIVGETIALGGSYKTYIDMARFGSCQMEITAQPVDNDVIEGSTTQFIVAGSSPSAVYQWQINVDTGWANLIDGASYSGVHNDTFRVLGTSLGLNGRQFRAIGIAGACTDTSLPALLTVRPLSINEVNNPLSAYQLYPNPVNDILHIDGSKAKTGITSVEVSDISGKRIYQEQLNSTKKLSITTERWNAGIYLIRLSSGKNDAPHTFRIIKS